MKTKTSSTAHQTDESRPCTQGRDERAVAIIIALAVVGTLAVIGTTFSIGMNLEQRAAVNLRNAERARFASIAGVERAIAGMRIYSANQIFVRQRDIANPLADQWGYINVANPSFSLDTFDGGLFPAIGPGTKRIQSIVTPVSPVAAYRLRILDTQGQINLNMRGPGSRTLFRNLHNILGLTITADAIYNYREGLPGKVFVSKEHLREVPRMLEIVPGTGRTNYDIIRDLVTVHSWKDENVLEYGSSPLRSVGSGRGRSPININTAGFPVLYAMLRGLTSGTFTITDTEAREIANTIISRRNTTPFRTWNEFRNFIVNNLNVAPTLPTHVSHREDLNLILVNSNPNTAILDANPNRSWREFINAPGATNIGKRNLTTFTTEVCFNTGGYYEIQSIGYALDAAGNVIARNYVSSIVNVANKIRHSTQQQFKPSPPAAVADLSNTVTYPEPTIPPTPPHSPPMAVYDGQVRLQDVEWGIDWVPGVGGTTFFANFRNDGLNARDRNNVLVPAGGNLSTGAVNPANPVTTPPSRVGDLLPDGVFISTPGEFLTYPHAGNFPTAAADFVTLEFWVKMNVAPGTGRHYFFYLGNTARPPTEYVYIRHNAGNLELAVRDSVRGKLSTSVSITTAPIIWRIGEWNHVAAQIDWDNHIPPTPPTPPTRSTILQLFVDGTLRGTGSAAALYLLDTPMDGVMYVGSTEPTKPETSNANATIDSIRISNIARNYTPATVPYRYQASGTYRSATTFSMRFPIGTGFVWPVRWGTITWTGHEPPGGDISMQHRREYPPGVVGSWGAWTPILPSPTDIVINTTSHYIQYMATLTAPADRRDTPTLDDVTIVYLPRVRIVYWKEVDRLEH